MIDLPFFSLVVGAIGIDFLLRASTSAFTTGIATAKNAVGDFKKSLKALDLGGGISQWIGLGGLVAGFKSAISNARSLAEEAGRTGASLDTGTAALLRLGNTFDKISKAKDAFFGSITEKVEQVGIYFGKLVYGAEAAADAQRKLGEEAEAAMRKVANEKMLELEKMRKENAFKRASGEEQINILLREQVDLLNAQAKLQAGTIGHTEKAIAIEKNRVAIAEAMKKAKQDEDDIMRKVNDELTLFFTSVENGAKRIKETEEARLKAAQELANQAEREAAAKAKQLEVESTLKKLNDAEYSKTVAAMSLSGLSPKDVQSASDETLKEIARRKQGNLQSLGAGGGGLTFDDNYFTRIKLQNEINQVKAELSTRTDLRASVAASGIEGARRSFGGDPLVFDKLVQQFIQDTRTTQDLQKEQISLLKRIDDRAKTGAPVIVLNPKAAP